ncbi:nucleolar protein 12-domain-containing protein [Epithele typhae]|uniref:nucleolar protein 12-domain-containing protein n=1 Tax=Epithele typhae TaxID=378194 RepID=UPI002007E45D|nr:nucleolar protein 12-domain-containing protein [Epithele typhae]KAH9940428.1 nucleolar protein 12-domain-containing protein [Epithele typhae]
MASSSNISVLTKSHNIIAAKRRAKKEQLKEIVFDDSARRDFLTGFHKRKVQKKEAAKQKAMEREKQDRLEARREHRKLIAEQAKKNAEQAERAYRGTPEDGDDSGAESSGSVVSNRKAGAAPEEQEEYEDEEQLATVTVVEEFDPDSLIHGTRTPSRTNTDDDKARPIKSAPVPQSRAKLVETAKTKAMHKTSAKAKDIKYQTSAARKTERTKQRQRKMEKAERAGGKTSRRKGGAAKHRR